MDAPNNENKKSENYFEFQTTGTVFQVDNRVSDQTPYFWAQPHENHVNMEILRVEKRDDSNNLENNYSNFFAYSENLNSFPTEANTEFREQKL